MLSANFSLDELTRSNIASQRGINNTPSHEHIRNLSALCLSVLQPVRDHFGMPVKINSGFRSVELNRIMGGSPNSQHTLGQAADIEIPGIANDKIFQFIEESLVFDQLIAEMLQLDNPGAGWIHVSYSPRKRLQKLSYLGKDRGYSEGLKYL